MRTKALVVVIVEADKRLRPKERDCSVRYAPSPSE